MAKFGTQLQKTLMLVLRFIFVFLIAFNFLTGAQTRAAERPVKVHYELTASSNDGICRPILALYNDMLSDYIAKWSTKKLTDDEGVQWDDHEIGAWTHGWATDFEIWEPARFEKIGFTKPKKFELSAVNSAHQVQHRHKTKDTGGDQESDNSFEPAVYLADIFNEGKPRIIDVYDGQNLAPNKHTFDTTITVLKKDAIYDRTDSVGTENIGPNLVDRQINDVPSMAGPTSARIFIHANQVYFILNNYTLMAPKPHTKAAVLVYRLTPTDKEELCRLTLGAKP